MKELKRFIRFNYRLYKGNPYSVPDLYDDMLNTFNKKKNAAFEFCEAEYFLAYKDNQIVGRVAAIINHKANQTWNKKNVRFGWIDFIDDPEVSDALIRTVEEWGKERGMTHIQGPLGFTDFDAEGMLVEGFDQLSTMATIYNYPYYPQHMERMGFAVDAEGIRQFGDSLRAELNGILQNIYAEVGYEFNLNSPKQLGDCLLYTSDAADD